MHVLITDINGNPNVGLYGFANDHFCLLGEEVPETTAKQIGQVLGVPVHPISLCGTSLIGVFCAGNNHGIVIPDIVFADEKRRLEKLGIPFTVIKTRHTALGNNLLCNDQGCLASNELSADAKKSIRQALDVPLKPGSIATLDIVGSCAAVNAGYCLVNKHMTPEEQAYIEELLGVVCTTGTLNMGSPFIRSGIICNKNGFVTGNASGGPEITNADQALGYLKI